MNVNGNAALTTFDNPYNPFTQFQKWFLFDTEKGHNSCAYLARIARTSDEFTEEENEKEIERAIDEIIQYDFMNKYKKIYKNIKK
jgi:hypothetical protein